MRSTRADNWVRPKRVARLTSQDVENRMLSAARRMLDEAGLTVSIEHLRMEDLIQIAGVPRSSVYRRWNSKDEFFDDLLERLATQDNKTSGLMWDDEIMDLANSIIAENADLMATVDGRSRVLREVIRQCVEHNYETLIESPNWRTHSALLATAMSMAGDQEDRLLTALRKTERRFIKEMAGFYEELLKTFQIKFRDGVSTETAVAAGAAVIEGMLQRRLVTAPLVDQHVPGPGPRGDTVPWHAAAVAYYGVMQVMLANNSSMQ